MADDMPLLMTMVRLRERHSDLMREYGTFDDEPTPAFIAKIIAFQTDASAAGAGISSSDERFEAQSKINYWQTARINAGQRPDTVLLTPFDQAAAKDAAGNRSPYKGLAPFLTGDSKFFAGRYELVGKLVANVKKVRLLALLGLSGSGKSSVIRAGLIPDLKDGAYDGIDDDGLTNSQFWKTPEPILPGADPLKALEDVYDTITTAADLPTALDRLGSEVVLSIDQFEEVFTLSDEKDQQVMARRALFLDALVAAATTGQYRHVVVITMRSEYDSYVAKHPAFSALFSAGREIIQAMQASDLRKVIEEPANRLGIGFDPGLVDELMTKVQGEPAGLPLLSFTLLKLWEMRAGGPMKMADYQKLGGNPRDILANSATEVYKKFPNEDQFRTQDIFTRLVKIGDSLEATSQRTSRADLPGARDNINHVLDVLIDAGLLRSSPPPPDRAAASGVSASDDPLLGLWITDKTQFEVAHEALIRNWGLLTDWVKDSFAKQTNRKAFTLRAQKWDDGAGDLLSGLSLDEAKNFPDKSPVEIKYIAASHLHEQSRQRKYWIVLGLIAVLAIAAVILAVMLFHKIRADGETQRANAAYATAASLVDRGEILLAKKVLFDQLPDNAKLPPRVTALLQAARLDAPQEYLLRITSPAEWRAIMAASKLPHGPPPPAQPRGASIQGNGQRLLSLWTDGSARIWNRAKDGLHWSKVPMVLTLPDQVITAVTLSPDGKRAMSASVDRAQYGQAEGPESLVTLQFWDIVKDHVSPSGISKTISAFRVNSIKFDTSGYAAVLATNDGNFIVVDGQTGEISDQSKGGFMALTSATFSVDDDKILTAGEDGRVELFDFGKHDATLSIQAGKKAATSARFTTSGVRFAVGSADGIIRIYRTTDGQKLFELAGHRKSVTGIALSSDGSMLISSSDDGTLRFWELGINAGQLSRTIAMNDSNGHPIAIKSVALSDNDTDIIVALADGSIHAFDLDGKLADQVKVGPTTPGNYPAFLAISPDRNTMVAFGALDTSPAPQSRYQLIDLKQAKVRATWDDISADAIIESQISDSGDQLVYTRQLDAIGMRQTQSAQYQVESRSMTPGAVAVSLLTSHDYPLLVALAPDASTIIIVDASGQISGFDKNGKKLRNPLQDYQIGNGDFDVTDAIATFSQHGKPQLALAISGNPRTFVYDLTTGKIVQTFKSRGDAAALQFSPDGTALFIGTDLGTGALYDIESGDVRRLAGQHDSGITFASFSPDAGKLVTGSNDATARIWDATNGRLLRVLRGHQATLTRAMFAPDGKHLLTESDDRSVKLWDIETGRQLTTLRGPFKSDRTWGRFTADGKNVQTLSDYPSDLIGWNTSPMLRTWNFSKPPYDYARPYGYAELRKEACAGTGALTQEDIDRSGLDMEPKRLNCRALGPAR